MKSYWKIVIICVLVVIAAGIQFIARKKNEGIAGITNGENIPRATTTIPTTGIVDPSGKGYVVKPLPLPKATPALKAPDVAAVVAHITPATDYDKTVFSTMSGALAAIKRDSENYDAWLTVGIALQQLEKYEAARDVFTYIATLWPTEAVTEGDLGSLYHLYLKDFPKSEAAYERAIELDPSQRAWYRGLYELYRYSYKTNTSAWEDILKKGYTATGAVDLIAALAGRYAELGRFSESVAAYDTAIAEAEKQNNQKLIDQLVGLRAAARAQIK